jgi:hypothetical protein
MPSAPSTIQNINLSRPHPPIHPPDKWVVETDWSGGILAAGGKKTLSLISFGSAGFPGAHHQLTIEELPRASVHEVLDPTMGAVRARMFPNEILALRAWRRRIKTLLYGFVDLLSPSAATTVRSHGEDVERDLGLLDGYLTAWGLQRSEAPPIHAETRYLHRGALLYTVDMLRVMAYHARTLPPWPPADAKFTVWSDSTFTLKQRHKVNRKWVWTSPRVWLPPLMPDTDLEIVHQDGGTLKDFVTMMQNPALKINKERDTRCLLIVWNLNELKSTKSAGIPSALAQATSAFARSIQVYNRVMVLVGVPRRTRGTTPSGTCMWTNSSAFSTVSESWPSTPVCLRTRFNTTCIRRTTFTTSMHLRSVTATTRDCEQCCSSCASRTHPRLGTSWTKSSSQLPRVRLEMISGRTP